MTPDPDDLELETWLRAALDLDQDERTYVANLDLAAEWRTERATAADSRWGWLVLFGVVATFIALTAATNAYSGLLATANQVGLVTVLLTNALGVLLGAAHSLIEISTSPALGLSQPLLAVLALALLFWPRIASAPHYLQGVRS